MIPLMPPPQTRVTLQPMDVHAADSCTVAATVAEAQGRRLVLSALPSSAEALSGIGAVSALEMSWPSADGAIALPVTLTEVQPSQRRLVAEVLERRSHTRVDTSMTFRCTPLTGEEATALATRIHSQPMETLSDPAEPEPAWSGDETSDRLDAVLSSFHQMLADLREKVDHLIALQEGRAVPARPEHRCHVLNISGSGVAFESEERFAQGTKLRLTFDLQRYPYRSIVCLGDVVRVQHLPRAHQPAGHLIQAQFTEIAEEDRDRIIHHVFRLQRRALRHRRSEAAPR